MTQRGHITPTHRSQLAAKRELLEHAARGYRQSLRARVALPATASPEELNRAIDNAKRALLEAAIDFAKADPR